MNKQLLPATLAPRGLKRHEAAAYIGVGVSKFDEMVRDGRMPQPRRIDARRVWDRRELDQFFDALPNDGEEAEGDNPWDRAVA